MGKKVKLKIGIYCRVSSESQSENTSLGKQNDLGIKFCESNNFEYEVFSEIVSGTKIGSDREVFKKLEDKLYNGELNGIWLYDWDRMIRELGVGVLFRDLIISTKCKLFVGNSEKDILSDSGSLEFGIGSVFSDYWRRKISREMNSGKKRKLENDEIFLGVVGIGYEKIEKKIKVDERKRELIENCFNIYLKKDVKTYRDLIKKLKLKYKEGLDERINEKSVSRLLNDEKFKGIYNLEWKGNNYKLNIGRIISDDLFDKVKEKIDFNKGLRKGNTKGKYLLKGYIKCSDCGDNMWVKGSGIEYRYYECRRKKINNRNNFDNRFNEKKCVSCENIQNNVISVSKLEFIVWNSLFEVLGNSESLKEEYLKKYSKEEIKKNEFNGKLKFYEKAKNKLIKDKTNIIKLLVKGDINVEEKNLVSTEIDNELNEISEKYLGVKKEYERIELSNDILDYVNRFEIDLKKKYELKRFEDKRRWIEKYIKEVKVKYLGKDENGSKEYNINIKVNLFDEFNINKINEKDDKFKYKNDLFLIYISNLKGVEICDLIYNNILEIDYIINVSISDLYIDFNSSKIIDVK